MITTIEELKKRGKFTVESWHGVKHYVGETVWDSQRICDDNSKN